MLISIIVPCRNEQRHIRQLLESIQNQEIEPGCQFETLIADGQSDDGTRAILNRFGETMRGLRIIDNPGLIVSTGLNAALAVARGDVIIRMDAHTTYAADYVRECVRVLRESGADNVGGPWIARGHGVWGRAIAAAFRSRFCCGGGGAHNPEFEGEVDTVYLGCWPRSVFERVGLFDPELVRNQDDEFNFRLRRVGGKLWQSPSIKSSYVVRGSLKSLFRQYLQYGYWKVAVIRKHGHLASWRHIVPALFVSSLIIFPLLTASAAVLGLENTAGAFAAVCCLELAAYLVVSILAALSFVGSVEVSSLVLLPVVFGVYHAAYGLGFLRSAIAPAKKPSALDDRNNAPFTALTR